MRSKRFIGVASVPVRLIALALLTSTSMPPNSFTAASTAPATDASSRMSQTIGSARAPAAAPALVTVSAAVWIVPGSLG